MAKAPPKFTIPPAPTKARNSFDRFINAHAALKQYKTTIQQWAGEYGVPALWVAAVLVKESGGKNAPWQVQNGQRVGGIAQLNLDRPPVAARNVLGRALTAADVMNVGTSIQILAYAMAGSASVDDFYKSVWNPGHAAGSPVYKLMPSQILKGYQVSVTGHTPQQKAAGAAAAAQAKAQNLVDQQNQARQLLDPIYLAYAGRRATKQEINGFIANPTSTYQIEMQLSDPKKNPNIYKSPIYLTHYGDYESVYKQMFGQNADVPKGALLYGIVHNLSQTAFAQELRDGKVPGQLAYAGSEEFKGNMADATKIYAQIYGTPDQNGLDFLKSAVLGGWNQSQIENYLRSRPEYTSSGEYKTRAMDFAQRMGLIQGGVGQTALAGNVVPSGQPFQLPSAPVAPPPVPPPNQRGAPPPAQPTPTVPPGSGVGVGIGGKKPPLQP